MSEAVLYVMVAIIVILFAGKPCLMDSIIKRVDNHTCVEQSAGKAAP